MTTLVGLVLLSKDRFEVFNVWLAVIAGRKFNILLFTDEWLIIFSTVIFVWLFKFTAQEKTIVDSWLNESLKKIRSPASFKQTGLNTDLSENQAEAAANIIKVFGGVKPLDEHEILAFRHMIDLEKGPNIFSDNEWKKELTQVSDPRVSNPVDSQQWLVMGLDEVSGIKPLPTGNALDQNIEKLLTEQENLVFNMHDQGDDCEKAAPMPSLKVVYRSKDKSDKSMAPGLIKAWESKSDKIFYEKLIDACDR